MTNINKLIHDNYAGVKKTVKRKIRRQKLKHTVKLLTGTVIFAAVAGLTAGAVASTVRSDK